MYRNILITTDGSELAERGIKHGIELAKSTGAKLTAVTVVPPFNMFGLSEAQISRMPEARAQYETQHKAHADAALERVAAAAKAAGVPVETLMVEHEHPYEGIVNTAKKTASDVIVISSHGRSGLSSMMLGSVAQKVLAHSKVPLLICH